MQKAEKDPQYCADWYHTIVVTEKQMKECITNARNKMKLKDRMGALNELKKRKRLQYKMELIVGKRLMRIEINAQTTNSHYHDAITLEDDSDEDDYFFDSNHNFTAPWIAPVLPPPPPIPIEPPTNEDEEMKELEKIMFS